MFKKQKRLVQGEVWINSEELALPPGNTFYDALDAILDGMDFDAQARALCAPYYKMSGPGQPGTDPAVYFKLSIESLTADKGYHSLENLEELGDYEIIPNIPDPHPHRNLGKLSTESRQTNEWSRATVASVVGKELQRARGKFIERSFAHILDAGGMRRTTLRGRENIQKRYSIAAMGYNIALLMCVLYGAGMPKQWAAMGLGGLHSFIFHCIDALCCFLDRITCLWSSQRERSVLSLPVGINYVCTL